jgi:transposase
VRLLDEQQQPFFFRLGPTSTYFEGEAEETLKAKRGYSRDHRPDCLQVILALVITPEGLAGL